MTYLQQGDYQHGTPEKLGVLLVNLGTPESPSTHHVRRFLAEFLSDPRVIEVPRAIWWLILHGIILRTRPSRSAKAYRKIWTEEGSPLFLISKRQADGLQQSLSAKLPGEVQVALGMRYGQPSIADALHELRLANAQRILILPLYPQYSATTTASIFDAVTATLGSWRWLPEFRFVRHYHDNHGYISALAKSVTEFQQAQGKPDLLLFSFHGIPKSYFLAGDPYYCYCQKTARLVAERLELAETAWEISFQSRVGPKEWLQPYTEQRLEELGASECKHIQVICPGFAADCLETLEEIALANKATFLAAGGEDYHYIPALNDRADHLDALTDLVVQQSAGWPETSPDWNQAECDAECQRTVEHARKQGAER